MEWCIARFAVAAALVGAWFGTGPAWAGTLMQTFTFSMAVNITDFSANPTVVVPDSFFVPVSFAPFVGSGLTSAVFTASHSFSGNFTNGGTPGVFFVADKALFEIGGTAFRDVSGFGGGGAGPNQMASVSYSASSFPKDLLFSAFDTLLTGSDPIVVTQAPAGQADIALVQNHTNNVQLLTGTISFTETLVYGFNGDGALLQADVPEPSSLALLIAGGLGLAGMRRRRSVLAA